MGRKQHQQDSASLHHRREICYCVGFHLLYLQLSDTFHQCAHDHHRHCSRFPDDSIKMDQEAKHQDGKTLYPQPPLKRHHGTGKRREKPLYEGHLLDRDIHIGDFDVPEDSSWGGKTLKELHLRERFGVDMSSIMRGSQRLNIPNGDTVIFPGDKLQVIGNDDQLQKFATALSTNLIPEDLEIEKREMKLRQLIISGKSEFCGKSLLESGIRDKYNCMVVGLEEGQENLTKIAPTRTFEKEISFGS